MALMTGQQYKDSIRDMDINVYLMGKKIENQVDHPITGPAMEAVALAYDLAHDPEHQDRLTTTSHISGEKINFFTHLYRDVDVFVKRLDLMRDMARRHGMCHGARCVSGNIANGLESITFEMDKKLGTEYSKRFRTYWDRVQREDLSVGGYITDPKGDRSKRPADQENPDAYVRIVDEKKDGIVVRGAKVLISGASIAHEALIMPTRGMREDEKAHAVSFAVPTDTPGLTLVHQLPSPDFRRLAPDAAGSDFGNERYGVYNACQIFFDDVFVPWDRVFMCGEVEYTNTLVGRVSPTFRCVTSSCKCGHRDLLLGGSAVIADYNGVGKAGHIRDKLSEMSFESELSYGCLLGAAQKGYTTESGNFFPNALYANVGKYQASKALWFCARMGVDISGGLVMSMHSQKDMDDPVIGPLIEKYFKANPEVSTEKRMKMMRMMEYLTGIGNILVAESSQGGAPTANQQMVVNAAMRSQLEEYKKRVLELADIQD
ncbi:MAG: 4-hydroxybutyryl-CoA dehydratase [Deltaproteobacteria bacterium]|nr:4-hydroxybutyryl-CoA dehydratase [Deltaproteobacteria bacterium]MBW1815851.1 4-hydroxybutyryl-CoA dehydratase [Deltaproteobacteria bacterium]MBW2284141.1 4-hydroxybutyryl-CoA dehydratase [Deltaproteobacteria bacterium]